MTTGLQIRLLGGLQISLDGAPLTGFLSGKIPALLAYLAVTQREHQRDALATLFWGEMGDEAAANNLRQALSNLRKLVEPYLRITRETVEFLHNGPPVSLDVLEFEQAIHAAQSATRPARVVALQRACDLYQGDLLAGVVLRDAPDFDDWLLPQRIRLREQALHALHVLADLHLARAEYGRAIDCATRLLALDAWREEGHRQLMLALAHSGRRTAALAQYARCRRLLADELGVEPAHETTALAAHIRAAGATPRHNLPPQPTALVGRSEELTEIAARFLQPDCRLLTVVGAGGMGKTRLALHAAAQAHQQGLFLDGVFFVPLGGAATRDALAVAVADAVGFQFSGSRAASEQLLAHLRDKEILLLLDNFEGLLDEAAWLAHLLERAPQVKLLITSREALQIRWEWQLPVEGLAYPPPGAHTGAAAYDSVQLFIARATAVCHDFAPDEDTLAHVAAICRSVDGMPLGIELAAAQLRHYSCAEIAAALRRNLDFLAATYRDLAPRHRSLRAVFDTSWQTLSDDAQTAFAALGTFAGSFSIHAAGEIARTSRPVLQTLVEKSLLRREGDDRFVQHEMVRQYALVHLDAIVAQRLRAAHCRYYCALVAAQTPHLRGARQQEALRLLAQDWGNVRAAWDTALLQQRWDILHSALDGIFHYFMVRGRFLEGLELLHAARQTLESTEHDPTGGARRVLAHLLTREARLLSMVSRYEESKTLLLQTYPILQELHDVEGIATAQVYLGAALASLGEYETARHYLEEGLARRRTLADNWGQAVCYLELAGLAYHRGEFAQAQGYCEEGLRHAATAGDPEITAHLLTAASILARQQGDFTQARAYVTRSLAMYEALDDAYGIIQALLTLGGLAIAQQLYADARPYFLRAVEASYALGFLSGAADSHCRLGQIAVALHDDAEGVKQLEAALRIACEIQEAPLLLDTLYTVTLFGLHHHAAEAAPLIDWILAQSELDAQRRADLVAARAAHFALVSNAVAPSKQAALDLARRLLHRHAADRQHAGL